MVPFPPGTVNVMVRIALAVKMALIDLSAENGLTVQNADRVPPPDSESHPVQLTVEQASPTALVITLIPSGTRTLPFTGVGSVYSRLNGQLMFPDPLPDTSTPNTCLVPDNVASACGELPFGRGMRVGAAANELVLYDRIRSSDKEVM